MNFSEKLKAICKKENINLKEFSALTNISYDTIAAYSRGRRTPSWEQIHKIANTPQLEKYQQFILSPDSDKIETATSELKYSNENEELLNVINEKMIEYHVSAREVISKIDAIFINLDESINGTPPKNDNDNEK